MARTTGITWCDATFNPWIGCTKISAGCANCYAETENKRYQWNPAGWGRGAPRKRTSDANWGKPIQWAKQAKAEGKTIRVFCASLADVFDDEVDPQWRVDLFMQIMWIDAHYPNTIEWLLLTKRPENIYSMLPMSWKQNAPGYVRLGVTAENQENWDKRTDELIRVWKGKNFVSVEPMLDWILLNERAYQTEPDDMESDIDWVVVGGESGAGCRPMKLKWARELYSQCITAGIPFFFKQIGGHPDKRHNPEEWPEDLRVQEFPKPEGR